MALGLLWVPGRAGEGVFVYMHVCLCTFTHYCFPCLSLCRAPELTPPTPVQQRRLILAPWSDRVGSRRNLGPQRLWPHARGPALPSSVEAGAHTWHPPFCGEGSVTTCPLPGWGDIWLRLSEAGCVPQRAICGHLYTPLPAAAGTASIQPYPGR